jgi:hypothetical protein
MLPESLKTSVEARKSPPIVASFQLKSQISASNFRKAPQIFSEVVKASRAYIKFSFKPCHHYLFSLTETRIERY